MKVLIVSPQPFYEERGTPIAVRMLAESLVDCGHQVDLLVYHCGMKTELNGVRIIRAPAPPGIKQVPIGISGRKLVCDLALVWRFLQLVRQHSYDVVHAVEEAVFPAVLFKRKRRYRVVYDMDSLMSQQLVEKWTAFKPFAKLLSRCERFAIGHCDAVLAVCDDLAQSVLEMVPIANVRVLTDVPITKAYDASAENVLGPPLRRSDSLVAMYVGNLEHYQGVENLIRALALVPQDVRISLVIAGGHSTQIAAYQRLIPKEHRERVVFLGHRPLWQLSGLLAQADILVSPRLRGQNTPMKVYSYMQCGKAILATAIRAHQQVLDRECAMLVDPTPEALAQGLLELAQNSALRHRLGRAAMDRVDERHSAETFRRVLSETYHGLDIACAARSS